MQAFSPHKHQRWHTDLSVKTKNSRQYTEQMGMIDLPQFANKKTYKTTHTENQGFPLNGKNSLGLFQEQISRSIDKRNKKYAEERKAWLEKK